MSEKEADAYVLTKDEIFEWFWKGYQHAMEFLEQRKKDVRVTFENEHWRNE